MRTRWGKLATEPRGAAGAAAEGFDFVQPAAGLAAEPAEGGGLPFLACALPLPAEAWVTQQGFNLYAWTEHLKRSVRRLAGLGCRKLLWSDGRARVLPEEGELAGLEGQVLQFLFLLGEAAAGFGMEVLVEPLGPRRTNFLNTMGEIGEFLPRVGRENLASLVSLRELEPIGLPLERLREHRRLIRYVQLENPRMGEGARVCPRPADGVDYLPFLRALKGMGYDGEIGLPADADAEGLAYCRGLWERA